MEQLLDCGHKASEHSDFTTGYGVDAEGKKHCYECCAKQDKEWMIENGRITLYLSDDEVTNWPGSLRFKVGYKKEGHHNMAGKRYDVWFTGPNGKNWHGVQYGDNIQLCHCKRIKS